MIVDPASHVSEAGLGSTSFSFAVTMSEHVALAATLWPRKEPSLAVWHDPTDRPLGSTATDLLTGESITL